VVLNLDTLIQYQGIKLQETQATLCARYCLISPKESEVITSTERDEYFDTYSVSPEESGEHFFDAMEEIEMLVMDLFQLDDLCMPIVFIDCIRSSDEEILQQETSETSSFLHKVNGPTTTSGRPRGLSDQALAILATDPQVLVTIAGSKKAVIFDTGASLVGITYDRMDFDGPLSVPEVDLRLGGMAQGLKIEGIGAVTWTFRNVDGSELTIRSQCYYVPNAKVQLLNPQRLFNKSKGVSGKFEGDEESFSLQFDGFHRLIVEYDVQNHLPIGYATIGGTSARGIIQQANLALLDETNQDISAGHKLLMNWHGSFGHLNFPAAQRILRHFPFASDKFAADAKCDHTNFRCEICQFAKAHRRTTHGRLTHVNEERDGGLKS
jgi:hypothetical protein